MAATKPGKAETLAAFYDEGTYTALFADGPVSAAYGCANGQSVYVVYQNGQPLESEIHVGIGHDSQKTEAERALEYAEQQLHKRIEDQGIPRAGAQARALLLARMGINRGETRA